MNIYSVQFFARCPVNNVRILYSLRIETQQTIPVEEIIDRVDLIREGFQEDIADNLLEVFGGRQKLIADHHGVTIETLRP